MTAVGLGGPLTGGALGADPSTPTTSTSETPPVTNTGTSTEATPPPTTTTTTSTTTTSTTPTTSTESTTPPSTTPAPSTVPQPPPTTTTAQTPAPAVERQVTQKPSTSEKTITQAEETRPTTTTTGGGTLPPAGTSGNVASAPQTISAPGSALGALLASSPVSTKALEYFQVPLFLLPIYQAAAIQYGVPWEILAAINEVETDYGTDLNVSTAGAVGWMQFMPQTWLQYGVDALNAGYADPYNPVDAIFAAARYLRAAGAATDLHDAIFAYNHSNAYVESVLLRARLLASYPQSVLATLTGLTEGRPPVNGAKMLSAPANAAASKSPPTGTAPSPLASARKATEPTQFVTLLGQSHAPVVAVEDGRVVALGTSRKLGRYLTLRDVYGDVFTYADLGSVATDFKVAKAAPVEIPTGVQSSAQTSTEGHPTLPASAGHQPSVATTSQASSTELPTVTTGKVRLFAHPNNPEAIAATARVAADGSDGDWLALRRGSVLPQGTVIGHMAGSGGAHTAELRFAIRPAGDESTIDPRPILENWGQLNAALHPQGAKGRNALIGATADDVYLLTHSELQRAVLSDPGITLNDCDRQTVASGAARSGVLAALLFLSRSGLKPTVGALRCGLDRFTPSGSISPHYRGQAVDISKINGVSITNHQGAGTITDITIRTLLTLQGQFAPRRIISLMRYPGAHNTVAHANHGAYIELEFSSTRGVMAANPAKAASSHTQAKSKTAPSPLAVSVQLSSGQWNRLVNRIGSLPTPNVPTKPSKAAIRDPQAPKANQDLGKRTLP